MLNIFMIQCAENANHQQYGQNEVLDFFQELLDFPGELHYEMCKFVINTVVLLITHNITQGCLYGKNKEKWDQIISLIHFFTFRLELPISLNQESLGERYIRQNDTLRLLRTVLNLKIRRSNKESNDHSSTILYQMILREVERDNIELLVGCLNALKPFSSAEEKQEIKEQKTKISFLIALLKDSDQDFLDQIKQTDPQLQKNVKYILNETKIQQKLSTMQNEHIMSQSLQQKKDNQDK